MKDKVIFTFRVMHDGWEMDNVAWVMERPDGTRYLQMTSHGDKFEVPVARLEDKIDEYRSVLAKSERAWALLQT